MAPNPPFVDNEKPSTAKWNTLVGRYDVATSEIDVVSTASETTLYSKSISAGDLSSDRMLRLTLIGDYLNNSGANRGLVVRVKFGGTTIYDNTGDSFVIAAAATRRDFSIDVVLGNLGATNAQFVKGRLEITTAVAVTTGLGRFTDAVGTSANTLASTAYLVVPFGSNGALAVDTTAACTLEVTVQHAASSASLSMRRKYASLELL